MKNTLNRPTVADLMHDLSELILVQFGDESNTLRLVRQCTGKIDLIDANISDTGEDLTAFTLPVLTGLVADWLDCLELTPDERESALSRARQTIEGTLGYSGDMKTNSISIMKKVIVFEPNAESLTLSSVHGSYTVDGEGRGWRLVDVSHPALGNDRRRVRVDDDDMDFLHPDDTTIADVMAELCTEEPAEENPDFAAKLVKHGRPLMADGGEYRLEVRE